MITRIFGTSILKYDETDPIDWEGQDIFIVGEKVYFKTNASSPMQFFVIDYENRWSYDCTMMYQEMEENKGFYREAKRKDYGRVAFNYMKEYLPIFEGMTTQYQFEGVNSMNIHVSYGIGSLNEITQAINEDGICWDTRKTNELLIKTKALLTHLRQVDQVKEAPWPGFFLIDRKLQTNIQYEKPSTEKLKSAVKLLLEYSKYFETNLENLGYVLKWLTMAPFSFYYKQKGSQPSLVGSLYLWGKSNSGKSTVAHLSAFLWGRSVDEVVHSVGSANTEARFGGLIGNSTFPVVVEEGEMILLPIRGQENQVLSIFKTSMERIIAREKHESSGQRVSFPALAPVIFTSNRATVQMAEIGRRLHVIEWTIKKPPTEAKMKEFVDTFRPTSDTGAMKILKAIGEYVATYVLENQEVMNKPWEDTATMIWKKIFEEVDMEMPEWLVNTAELTNLEESYEAEEDQLFSYFRQLLLRKAETGWIHGDITDDEIEEDRPRTVKDKLEDVVNGAKETWIQRKIYTQGANKGKDCVIITSEIVEDMKRQYGVPYDLKRIAEDLDGEYKSIRLGKRTQRVAEWGYEHFLETFGGDDLNEPESPK